MGYRKKKRSNFLTGMAVAIVVFLVIFVGYTIFTQIQEHHKQNDPKLHEIKARLTPLIPDIVDLDFYEGDRSYTINKQRVYLCLRDENGNYYDDNTLNYVTLHELAHTKTKSIGHTEEFHEVFDDILKKATEQGLFNPSIPVPNDYCTY